MDTDYTRRSSSDLLHNTFRSGTEQGMDSVARHTRRRTRNIVSFPDAYRNSAKSDTVVEWTKGFMCTTIRGCPFLRSSHVLTKDADSVDSTRPLHYSKSDHRVARAPALSPCSSITHAYRFIGYRNRNPKPLTDSDTRLITLPTTTLLVITCTQVLWFLERLT